MDNILQVKDLSAYIKEQQILKKVNLEINTGELHILMGPNGSGKSTLANVLMGNPKYKIDGQIIFKGQDISELKPEERAHKGLFLAFQYPREIVGVQLNQFLFLAYQQKQKALGQNQVINVFEFNQVLEEFAGKLGLDKKLLERNLNYGFSGGEKKKVEMLQMLVLEPELAILDETDSGLDVDSLKIVAKAIKEFHKNNNSVLLITHHKGFLDYLKPDFVHIMFNGKIVQTGNMSLVKKIEKHGFESLFK